MYDRFLSPQWIFDRCIEGSFIVSDAPGMITCIGVIAFLLFWATGKFHDARLRGIASLLLIPLVLIWLLGLFMVTAIGASIVMNDLLESLPVSPLYAAVIAFFVFLLGGWCVVALIRARRVRYWWAQPSAVVLSLTISIGSCIGTVFAAEFYGCNAYRQYYPALEAAHALHGAMKTWHDAGKPWPSSLHDLETLDAGSYKTMAANAKIRYIVDPVHDTFTLFVRPSRYSVAVFDDTYDYRYYQLHAFRAISAGEYEYPPDYPGPWDELP